jgi:hypothetical protein
MTRECALDNNLRFDPHFGSEEEELIRKPSVTQVLIGTYQYTQSLQSAAD